VRLCLTVVVLIAATSALAAAAPERASLCRPAAGLGTVTLGGEAVDMATCAERPAGRAITRPPFATVRRTGRLRNQRDTIWAAGRAVFSAPVVGDTRDLESPGPIEVLGWSGDRRWVFFAFRPGGSGSIAADGLVLRVVSAAGGSARRLGIMLPYRDYLTWCGGRLVFTGGAGREATLNKHLIVASPPDWNPRRLAPGDEAASGSVACDGGAVVAQRQPSRPFAGFFATRWSLWRVGLDGTRTRLTRPPAGHADESPAVSPDGRAILFVRSRGGHGRLYALRHGRLLGPLLPVGYSLGYYGHQSWWQAMRWSPARRR
jgi:hypothetical protein